MERPGSHMHFDDRAAVKWQRALAPALAEASRDHKMVFVQVGKQECGGSRSLIERVLPKEEITEALRESFVCVCSEVASLEPAIAERLALLPRHEPTPVCMYLDGEGRVVHSTVGGRPPAVFLRDMTEALAAQKRKG